MILHLSAPLGNSGNDGIDKDQFPIKYSTVDEAISLVTSFDAGAVMAKVDLRAAFRMVPVSPGSPRHAVARDILCGHLPPLWIEIGPIPVQPICSTNLQRPSIGSCARTIK